MTETMILEIIRKLQAGDNIYASLEYGTKPVSFFMLYALQIILSDISVSKHDSSECRRVGISNSGYVVYGEISDVMLRYWNRIR